MALNPRCTDWIFGSFLRFQVSLFSWTVSGLIGGLFCNSQRQCSHSQWSSFIFRLVYHPATNKTPFASCIGLITSLHEGSSSLMFQCCWGRSGSDYTSNCRVSLFISWLDFAFQQLSKFFRRGWWERMSSRHTVQNLKNLFQSVTRNKQLCCIKLILAQM